MRKAIGMSLLFLLACSSNDYRQEENLESPNCFDIFKLGDSLSRHIEYIEKDTLNKSLIEGIVVYSCFDSAYLIFGATFKQMDLFFIDSSLCKMSLRASWDYNEYYEQIKIVDYTFWESVYDQAESCFGDMTEFKFDKNASPNNHITSIWHMEKSRLELDFVSNKTINAVFIELTYFDIDQEAKHSRMK